MKIDDFKKLPIMGILRDVEEDVIDPVVDTVISSGLNTIEITMNTPDAQILIKQMVKASKGKLTIGAGTVLSLEEMHSALNSGATFIVSPTLVKDVVQYCVKNKIPVFPGALTPQEIYDAWQLGATMVKVFPARFFGPQYLREIKGPFKYIELLACGGVNPNNISEFFSCGASGIGFGASIFKPDWLYSRDYKNIEKAIKDLILGFHRIIMARA